MPPSSSSSFSSTTSLFLALFICGAAVLLHQMILFTNVAAPPADFGSGSMFDMIARRYDMINRILAVGMDMGWRKTMVEYVHDGVTMAQHHHQPPRILDVATGTADVALLLAERIPTATILGVDPSPNMLQVGREKIALRQLSDRITLQEHDARRGFGGLVVEDASEHVMLFDAATMAFGIRNIVEKQDALCQIHNILRHEALFCILEFSEPDDSFGIMGRGARFFIRHVIPFVGGVLSGKPREYWHLQNSIQDFPTPPEFVKLMERTTCATGNFKVEHLVQLNFGSVQLYVSRALRNDVGKEEESLPASAESPSGSSSSSSSNQEASES